jgi:cytochrome c-type biogenesis protein
MISHRSFLFAFIASFALLVSLPASAAECMLLIAVGILLLVPKLQAKFALAASPVSNWVGDHFGGITATSLAGQFGLGLLLGAVWSPCVGPTLGATSILAAKGENLGQVALTMLVFGIGAALPLMLIGLLSREAMMRWRGRMMEAGKGGKMLLGVLLVAVGLMVATGLDKRLETILVDASLANRAHHAVLGPARQSAGTRGISPAFMQTSEGSHK